MVLPLGGGVAECVTIGWQTGPVSVIEVMCLELLMVQLTWPGVRITSMWLILLCDMLLVLLHLPCTSKVLKLLIDSGDSFAGVVVYFEGEGMTAVVVGMGCIFVKS